MLHVSNSAIFQNVLDHQDSLRVKSLNVRFDSVSIVTYVSNYSVKVKLSVNKWISKIKVSKLYRSHKGS